MSYRLNAITGYEDLVRAGAIKHPKETSYIIKGREKQLFELSKNDFKNHEIMSESPGRWTIAAKYPDGKWTSNYLTEIITCRIGVFVSGDIDSVIFAGGDRGDSDRSRLDWVAYSSVSGYLDGKASMGFNSSTRNPAEEQDNDIAVAEMQSHVFDAYQEICENVLAEDEWEPDIKYDDDDNEIEELDPPATFNHETGKIECANEEHLAELLKKVDADIRESREIAAWADAIEDLVGIESLALELVKNALYDDLNRAGVCEAGEMIGDIGIVTAARVYYAHAACKKLSELLEIKDKREAVDNLVDSLGGLGSPS